MRPTILLLLPILFPGLFYGQSIVEIDIRSYPTCSGGGQLRAEVDQGEVPYPIFQWSSGGTGQGISNLRPDIYAVTVTSGSYPPGTGPYGVAGVIIVDRTIEYTYDRRSWFRSGTPDKCFNPTLRSNPCLGNSLGASASKARRADNAPGNTSPYPRQWYYSSNGSTYSRISGATGVEHRPTQAGYYKVIYQYSNSGLGINSVQSTYAIHVRSLTSTYYRDADGDGYGNPNVTTSACSPPSGYVSNNGDCNDNSSRYYPGASEGCGDPDYNCNGSVIRNYTNAGSISGNQSLCGTSNPSRITSSASPSGGSGGSAYYVWQVRTAGGSWTNISNSNSSSYDPPTISATRYYRRGVRRSNCTGYIFTNTVTKDISPAPSTPSTQSASLCGTGSIILRASGCSGGTLFWYSSSGGSSVNIGTSYTVAYSSGVSSKTFTVRCFKDGCFSGARAVTATWTSNVSSAGSITGNESKCGSYDPSAINSASSASGGTGQLEYRWEYRNGSSGSWTPIAGTNSTAYNPSTIGQTRQYRRGARRSGCGGWRYTSPVTKTVTSNVSNPGSISGTQGNCGAYDPGLISSSIGGSGGTGSLQYRWEYRNGLSGGWTLISGQTSSSYNPGTINQTRQYRRGARRSGCSTWLYTSAVTKTVSSNVTSGGSLSGSENKCGSYNPGLISNLVGAVWRIWHTRVSVGIPQRHKWLMVSHFIGEV